MSEWEGVSEFVAVAEKGSFTAAAVQLAISTAQVSRQVKQLEERLATKLFYRTTRKVTVTEAGQIYYQHCRQVLDGLDAAEQALTNLQSVPRGKLKITAPTTYGESIIAPLLNDFIGQYPDLELQYELTNQRVDLIELGFDLAIRLGKLEDSSMMAKRLAPRRQFVCASRAYIAAHGVPHTLSELSHHNCLKGTLEYWRFQEKGLDRNIKISGSISCNSGLTLLDAALKGLGLVQLPDYYVDPYLKSGQLIACLVNYQHFDEAVWALYPHNRQLSPKVKMLVEYLAKHLN
ncbi:MAG: LysR family transcriptional regulator [Oceanospirillaceae bacterium]|nr:LysR family transcriptional regulator [Oceanospirillaceae bacterium]